MECEQRGLWGHEINVLQRFVCKALDAFCSPEADVVFSRATKHVAAGRLANIYDIESQESPGCGGIDHELGIGAWPG